MCSQTFPKYSFKYLAFFVFVLTAYSCSPVSTAALRQANSLPQTKPSPDKAASPEISPEKDNAPAPGSQAPESAASETHETDAPSRISEVGKPEEKKVSAQKTPAGSEKQTLVAHNGGPLAFRKHISPDSLEALLDPIETLFYQSEASAGRPGVPEDTPAAPEEPKKPRVSEDDSMTAAEPVLVSSASSETSEAQPDAIEMLLRQIEASFDNQTEVSEDEERQLTEAWESEDGDCQCDSDEEEDKGETKKKAPRKVPSDKKADRKFYAKYSKKFGIKFDGTENKELLMAIEEWFGVPHKMGGCSKYGVDCSCFVKNVYKDVYGIRLNRTSSNIYYKDAVPVKKGELREGDIICFKIRGRRISHIGIYLKDNKFAHASSSRGVRVSDLNQKYFKRRYFSGGRIRGMDTKTAQK